LWGLADTDLLPDDLEGALSWVWLELSGAGKLWDEDAGSLRLSLSNDLRFGTPYNFLEYRHPDFRVRLGDGNASISPLVRGGSGFGMDLEGSLQLESDLSFGARALTYTSSAGSRWGLRVSAATSGGGEASANLLTWPGEPDALISGRLRLSPEAEGFPAFNLDLEYGMRLSAPSVHSALNMNASLGEGPNRVSASYRQIEAGYRDAASDEHRLDLSGGLQLSDTPELRASVRLRQEARYGAEHFQDEPEHYSLHLHGTLSGRGKDVSFSLRHDNLNEVNNAQGTSRQTNTLRFNLELPLTTELGLQQSLRWEQERHSEEGQSQDVLSYSAVIDLEALEGFLQPRLDLAYGVQEDALDTLGLGADWLGQVTDAFLLYASSGFYIVGDELLYLSAGGYYQFDSGQALDFNASVYLYRPYEPALQLSLGYNLPFEVPLSQLSAQSPD
jgi:hypothetical protein